MRCARCGVHLPRAEARQRRRAALLQRGARAARRRRALMEASVRTPLPYPELSLAPRGAHPGLVLDLAALLQPVPHGARGAVPRHHAGLRRRASTSARTAWSCSATSPRPTCSAAWCCRACCATCATSSSCSSRVQACARHRRDHAAHVRERRHAQRPGRDAADLADRRRRSSRRAGSRFLYAALATIALLLEQTLLGARSSTRRRASFLQPGCSRSAASPPPA